MIQYKGTREIDGGTLFVHVHTGDGGKPLAPRFDLRRHSPTGFECGYAGSGPAQLALAICADHLARHSLRVDSAAMLLADELARYTEGKNPADRLALMVYQDFKGRVVSKLPRDDSWALDDDKIGQWIDGIVAEQVKASSQRAHAQAGS